MPTPTYNEIVASLKQCVYLLHLIRDRAEVTATTIVTQIDTIQQGVEGDFVPELLDGVEAIRQRYAGTMSADAAQAVILPHLLHLARLVGWPETDVSSLMGRFYQYCVDNTFSVKSRNITFGSAVAGGSNAGTGTIYRLTKDENNFPIEACNVEVKTAECLGDANSESASGEEVFEIRGAYRSKDGLDTLGSGILGPLRAKSGRDTAQLLDNPSFDTYTGTASSSPTIQGWSVSTPANAQIDLVNYFRAYPETSTSASFSLKLGTGNVVVSQAFSVNTKAKLAPGVPYMLRVAWNREIGSASGTLLIRLGATSKSVVVAAQTGWQILTLDLDQGLWFRRFNEQGLDVTVEWTHTAGTILVDDVILVPMDQVDGTYFTAIGGATPFLRRDTFSFTDTGGTAAILQYWFGRATGHYLPSNGAGAETITDPP